MTDELSTQRMRADEVRALIRRLELRPPPACRAEGALQEVQEGAPEPEPPTLLYRPRLHRSSRGHRLETSHGERVVAAREMSATAPPDVDAARTSAHECSVGFEHDVPRRAPRVPAHVRVGRARRRSLLVGCVIVALLAVAPLLMALVRRAAGPDAPARGAELVRERARAARSAPVTQGLDAATQARTDPVLRATQLLMEGDSHGALSAFRMLARAHPEQLALGHVVRSLEQQLRACAEGSAPCR